MGPSHMANLMTEVPPPYDYRPHSRKLNQSGRRGLGLVCLLSLGASTASSLRESTDEEPTERDKREDGILALLIVRNGFSEDAGLQGLLFFLFIYS